MWMEDAVVLVMVVLVMSNPQYSIGRPVILVSVIMIQLTPDVKW
jgi:hypothetical protein